MKRRGRNAKAQNLDLERAWALWLDGEGPLPMGGSGDGAGANDGAGSGPGEATTALEALLAAPSELLPDPDSPLSGAMTSALVAALAARRHDTALARLSESPHRDLAKNARRALHDLRRKGVDVPDHWPASTARQSLIRSSGRTDRELEADDRRASMTTPYGDGERIVVLRFRGSGDRRLHAGVAKLSDEHGFRDLQLFLGKSRLYQQMAREMGQTVPVGEIPFEFAAWHLARAAERSRTLGRLLPEHWSAFRSLVKLEAETPPPHPGVSLRATTLPEPEAIFALWEDPTLKAWMAPRGLLDSLARRLSEAEASPIVVSEAQRQDRLGAAVDEAAKTLLEGEGRARLALRLQDAAWIAANQRLEEVAGQLLALREALLDSKEPHRLPFCRQLLVRPFMTRIPPALAAHLAPGLPGAPSDDSDPGEASPLWTPDSATPSSGEKEGGGRVVPGR